MIIEKLAIRFSNEPNRKPITFNEKTHFVVSKDNSKGKTTLMRLIAFSLCFDIPMTKGIESSKIETEITIKRGKTSITIIRIGRTVKIIRGNTKLNFDLKNSNDFASIASYVFGIDKIIEGGNLLGTIYIDQDNGWNLLSSGKVVGETKFSALNTIETLFSVDTTIIDKRISQLDQDIKRYQLVEHALEIKSDQEIEASNSFLSNIETIEVDKILLEKSKLIRKKDMLKTKISHITDVINSKRNIESYIDELGIMVQENKNSEPFRLTKDNLFLIDANLDGLRAQRLLYESSLRDVCKELDKYSVDYSKDNSDSLVDVKDYSSLIAKVLQGIPDLSLTRINSILKNIKSEKESLVEQRHNILKNSNSSNFLTKFEELFKNNLRYFRMLDSVYKDNDIKIEHYQNRGRFSGAELVKVVLSYRLAFHEIMCYETNTLLPLFIDSPGSKELKSEAIKNIISFVTSYGERMGIQVFISTVNTDGIELKQDNHHELTGKAIDLFEEEGLV